MLKRSIVRYILVGGTAYLIEMATLYLLTSTFRFGSLRAVAISFWVGFAVAFTLQKLVTFKNFDNRPRALLKQLLRYSLLVAWNYGFTLVAVRLFGRMTSVFVIRTLVIVVVTGWNYLLYKYIFQPTPMITGS